MADITRVIADQIVTSDSFESFGSFVRSIDCQLTATDSKQIIFGVNRSQEDQFTVVDSSSYEVIFKRFGTTVATANDTVTVIKAHFVEQNDSAAVADQINRVVTFQRFEDETTSATDTLNIRESNVTLVNDQVTAADSSSRTVVFHRSQNDGVIATEVVYTTEKNVVRINEQPTTTDSATRTTTFQRFQGDNPSANDSGNRGCIFQRSCNDSTSVVEGTVRVEKNVTRSEEQLTTSDQVSRIVTFQRFQDESVSATDIGKTPQKYTFLVSATVNNIVNSDFLTTEILDAGITKLSYINTNTIHIDIWTDYSLTAEEQTTLLAVITAHLGTSSLYTGNVINLTSINAKTGMGTDIYEKVASSIYGGTTFWTNIVSIAVICNIVESGTGAIRIYDSTNKKIIAEKTDITNESTEILCLGTVSNVPTSPAEFEVQVKAATDNLWLGIVNMNVR